MTPIRVNQITALLQASGYRPVAWTEWAKRGHRVGEYIVNDNASIGVPVSVSIRQGAPEELSNALRALGAEVR